MAGLLTGCTLGNKLTDNLGATVLFPYQGGTGIGTVPSYGQMLVGNSGGAYTLTATSSLGISASGGSNWIDYDNWLKPSSTSGIVVNASSTITELYSDISYATTSLIDNLFVSNGRISVVNATTTKIDTLTVNTQANITGNVVVYSGSLVLVNATNDGQVTLSNDGGAGVSLLEISDNTHISGTLQTDNEVIFPSARISTINSTTTNVDTLNVGTSLSGTGFTNAWNALANATTTQTNFTENWNTLHNATTTYPGFQTQFNTALNATSTWAGFTTNWNSLFNGTSTWAGFQSEFNSKLNATSTLDLATLETTNFFNTGARIATLNSTTTKIDNLTVNTGITVPADSISDDELNEGDTFEWTALHTFTDARPAVLNATTTNIDSLNVFTGATTTHFAITGLLNCDTIDTDASGTFRCGTDASEAGTGGSNWIDYDNWLTPSSTSGIVVNASSTITELYSDFVYATSSIIDNLFSTGARIATLNSTTTNIDTLTVNTAITVPADSISDDEINEGDTFEWTALHTWTDARPAVLNATTSLIDTLTVGTSLSGTGFTNAWNSAFNGTSTWTAFTANFNTLYNATTTQTNFTPNWNTLHNATTTYPGFQTQFNTALNATSTWAGFTTNWNNLLNATSTLDLTTMFCNNFSASYVTSTRLDVSSGGHGMRVIPGNTTTTLEFY